MDEVAQPIEPPKCDDGEECEWDFEMISEDPEETQMDVWCVKCGNGGRLIRTPLRDH